MYRRLSVSQTATTSMVHLNDTIEEPTSSFKRSYSVTANGTLNFLSPVEMGRQELYENLPFQAVFGLQKKSKRISMAFSSYAAELDVLQYEKNAGKELTESDKVIRKSVANLALLDGLDAKQDVVTTPLIIAVFVAALAQFSVGYNIGVMNAPANVVFVGHSSLTWSIAVASFAVGAPFGCMLAGSLAETRGRRGALLVNTWLFFLGGIIQTCSLNMFSIIIARAVIGFASGFSTVLVPIYLGELAPPTLRGMLGTLTQFALVIGILVSDLMAFPFASVTGWRILFALTPLTSVIQLMCFSHVFESPRWLLNQDVDSKKARIIIKKLRGLKYDADIETEVCHYINASKATDCLENDKTKKNGVYDMFADLKVRRLVISCLVLQVSQQLCGINAVFYYSNMFFEGVVSNPLVATLMMGAINVVGTYIALLLMDSCGRRTLLLWSSGVMFICCIVMVFSLLGYLPSWVALCAIGLYVTFFEIGLGPVPWLIVAEMFDAKYVTTAMSVSSQLNWVCNFIISITFPMMNEYLQAYSFAPFAVVLALCFAFTLFWLPETQGTTPQELQDQLTRKHSQTTYHNMDVVQSSVYSPINQEWKEAMEQIRESEEADMVEGGYNYGCETIVESVIS